METSRRNIFGKIIVILLLFLIVSFSVAQKNISSLSEKEFSVVKIFTNFADQKGLAPLMINDRLCRVADDYAAYLKETKSQSIYDPVLNQMLFQNGIYDFNMPLVILVKKNVKYRRLISEKLEFVLKREKFNMLGISVIEWDKGRDAIIVLLARRSVSLEHYPYKTSKQLIKISGKVEDKVFDLKLLVMAPAKKVFTYDLSDEQKFFEKTLKLPDVAGKYIFQIVGSDGYGVVSLALFPVYYKVPVIEKKNIINVSQDSFKVFTSSEAEKFIYQKINEVRQEYGLKKVKLNDNLSKLAAGHSLQMANDTLFSHGFVSEVSHSRAKASDKGIRYGYFSENIAVGQYLTLLHEKMLEIPYNVKNILDSEVTEVGIGVVSIVEYSGIVYYYVTQQFINRDTASLFNKQKDDILMTINDVRRKNSLPPLIAAPNYSKVAQSHAEDMALADYLDYVVENREDDRHISEKYRHVEGINDYMIKLFAVKDIKDVITEDVYSEGYNKLALGYTISDSPKYGKGTKWIVLVYINDLNH